jgi:hypothetical protein
MKTWKLFLAVALAAVALLVMTSIVFAAPASAGSAPVNRVYDDPEPVLTDTLPTTHPVGSMIAFFFNIPYTQVMELHDEGFGFGEIARVYLTAMVSGGALTPEDILAMRQEGVGWGEIKKDYGIHPGGNGLGTIMGNKPESTVEPPGHEDCPGNSCNAPGQQKPPKEEKPPKTEKPPKEKPPKPTKVPKN